MAGGIVKTRFWRSSSLLLSGVAAAIVFGAATKATAANICFPLSEMSWARGLYGLGAWYGDGDARYTPALDDWLRCNDQRDWYDYRLDDELGMSLVLENTRNPENWINGRDVFVIIDGVQYSATPTPRREVVPENNRRDRVTFRYFFRPDKVGYDAHLADEIEFEVDVDRRSSIVVHKVDLNLRKNRDGRRDRERDRDRRRDRRRNNRHGDLNDWDDDLDWDDQFDDDFDHDGNFREGRRHGSRGAVSAGGRKGRGSKIGKGRVRKPKKRPHPRR